MIRTFLVAVLAIGCVTKTAAALTESDFSQWHREALVQVEKDQYPKLRGFDNLRVLLVGGFLGEAFKDKYADMRRVLIRTGAEPQKISIITSPSTGTIEENAAKLRESFEELAIHQSEERLVVVGHSKGAAESLLALLSASSPLRKRVAGMFFIQGAFNGSPIADLFTGDGHPVDDGMASPYKQMLKSVLALDPVSKLAALEGYLGFSLGKSIDSLKTKNASELWEDALQKNPEGIADLDGKTFYIRSYLPPQEVRIALRVPAEYLSAYYGPNDGLIPLRSQTLGGFGRLLTSVRADHLALTKGNKQGTAEFYKQAAFSTALARSIHKLAGE